MPVQAVPFNQVRQRPDGTAIAWYRPEVEGDDAEPWLVIEEDPVLLGVEHAWQPDTYVADWIALTPVSSTESGTEARPCRSHRSRHA